MQELETPGGDGEPKKRGKKAEAKAPATNQEPKTYLVVCTARSPLLMDPMSEQQIINTLHHGKRESAAARKEMPPVDVARNKVLLIDGGPNVGAKLTWIMASLVAAGAKVKVGKSKISTAKSTELYGFLELLDENDLVPLYHPETREPVTVDDMQIDVRRGEKNGTAMSVIRPKFVSWAFDLRIRVDYSGMDGLGKSNVEELFMRAGRSCGIGAYRPNKKGPFGRFIISKFEEVKEVVA